MFSKHQNYEVKYVDKAQKDANKMSMVLFQ